MAKVFRLHNWGPVGEDDHEQCYTCGLSRKLVGLSDTRIMEIVRDYMDGKISHENLVKENVICLV